jgi:hypothetical protein
MITRVISVFFMARGFPSRDDPTGRFIAYRGHNKQNSAVGHSNNERPLFSMLQCGIGLFQPIWIFQSGDGIGKINAMLTAVQGPLGFVPLIFHEPQTTGYR